MPTLAELLATPLVCPDPGPRAILGSYDLVVELPADATPGDRLELKVRAGIVDAPGGGLCGVLRGSTVRGSERSEEVEFAQPAACQPVPEPGFVEGLAVLVVWALVIRWAARRMGAISPLYRPPPARVPRGTMGDSTPRDRST